MTSIPTEILSDAASKLLKIGRLDLARTVAELALAEDSGCASAHNVLAVVCDALAQWQEGQEHGRRAVELLPGSPQLRYNLALSTLRLDDYPTGFALMEARIDKPDWTALAIAPSRVAERHYSQGSRSTDGTFCRARSRRSRTSSVRYQLNIN
jgi:hypothetical protein